MLRADFLDTHIGQVVLVIAQLLTIKVNVPMFYATLVAVAISPRLFFESQRRACLEF